MNTKKKEPMVPRVPRGLDFVESASKENREFIDALGEPLELKGKRFSIEARLDRAKVDLESYAKMLNREEALKLVIPMLKGGKPMREGEIPYKKRPKALLKYGERRFPTPKVPLGGMEDPHYKGIKEVTESLRQSVGLERNKEKERLIDRLISEASYSLLAAQGNVERWKKAVKEHKEIMACRCMEDTACKVADLFFVLGQLNELCEKSFKGKTELQECEEEIIKEAVSRCETGLDSTKQEIAMRCQEIAQKAPEGDFEKKTVDKREGKSPKYRYRFGSRERLSLTGLRGGAIN